jgi:hypothetical protein
MFADTYAALASLARSGTLALILPNITFVIGVILYAIIGYDK